MNDKIPEADATQDEAYDLGAVSGYDEGYLAGRASRDAEVEALVDEIEVREAREQVTGRRWLRKWTKAVGRAEVAEATLLRVHRLLGSEDLGLRTYGISAEDLREALSGEHAAKA